MDSILAVLDTNVCLDLFVFRDPAIKPFHDAIKADTFHAITREDCREEWLRVLDYPKLNLDLTEKERSKLEFDKLIQLIEPKKQDYHLLPICSDKDDQKFMELAFDARARVLITKDKALLKLARKNTRNGFFRIISPDQWKQLV